MAITRIRLLRTIPILLAVVCALLFAQSDPKEGETQSEAESLDKRSERSEALVETGDLKSLIAQIDEKDIETAHFAANRLWQSKETLTPELLRMLFERFKSIDDEKWMYSGECYDVKMYIILCFYHANEKADAGWFEYVLDNVDEGFPRVFAAAWLARFDHPRGVDELTLLLNSKAYAMNALHRDIGELAQHVLLKLNFNKEWGFDASDVEDTDEFVSKWIPWFLENRYILLKKGKTSNNEPVFPCCGRGGCG